MVAQRVVRIREAGPEDLQTVLAIEYKCFPDPYPLNLLKRLHLMHPDGFLVADADEAVVGYVIGVLRWGETGHVLAIAVPPNYQRQRLGTMLLKNIIKRLRDKGARTVRLEVRKSNLAAQQFYKKLGFTEREQLLYYYEDGESAIAMEMPLD